MFFFVSLFFFHERKGKSGGVPVAEEARDTKSVVFAPDGGPRAMREQSVRCVRLRFLLLRVYLFFSRFRLLDIGMNQF